MNMKGLELYPYYHRYDLNCPEAVELVRMAGIWESRPPSLRYRECKAKALDGYQREPEYRTSGTTYGIMPRHRHYNHQRSLRTDCGKTEKATQGRKERYSMILPEWKYFGTRSKNKLSSISETGVDRIVFGSCLPFQYAEPQMVRLNQMGLKDEDMEKILYKNLQTLLTEKK